MKILKFGGTSVKNKTNILKVIDILKTQYQGKGKYTVVVSALGGTTDQLADMSRMASSGDVAYKEILKQFKKRHLKAAKELLDTKTYKKIESEIKEKHQNLTDLLNGIYLIRECSARTSDHVMSFGERNSAFIISHALNVHGIPSEYLDARKIIQTDKQFTKANVHFSTTQKNIQAHYSEHHTKLQVVTGFIASEESGLTTTLGRGGSDYTAAILANCLKAERLDIWTDVDGLLSSDPRKVKKSFTLPEISYREAMELSHFGAKVIYPPTIKPALEKKIPIYILNTFNPDFAGTRIADKPSNNNGKPITGLSSMTDISLVRLQGGGMVGLPGIAARLFSALAKGNINIILITQGSSEYAISFAIKSSDTALAQKLVNSEFKTEIKEGNISRLLIEKDLCILALVSEQMRNEPGVAGKLFSALGKEGINITAIAQGSSEYNISFVIHKNDEVKALNLIHDSFFLSDSIDIHLFIIGVGLIGSTLIDQIKDYHTHLKTENNINIKITGLANSKTMCINKDGISMNTWKKALATAKVKSDAAKFVKEMKSLNLPNSIFLDNTANADIPDFYKEILKANISVVTPNKVATSSDFKNYKELKDIAAKKKVSFLFETNVGAGLPVITTIRNLVSSGDQITSLQAVLSGSISYIFNTFSSARSFSDVVMEAKKLGLTEPDPRDDLSGMDVKRKITILAREAGLKVNMSEVKLKGILNKACLSAKTVEDFFMELEKMNVHFESLSRKAEAAGKKLRFIAKLDNGKPSIGLETVDSDSAFYNLAGSDNMLVIYTKRYVDRPLVIKGPGAGADVTAAGVFAEIVSIANKLI